MKTESTSPADPAMAGDRPATMRVWDLPVRVFHWSMVLCFSAAWLSADSERWRLLHVDLGYAMTVLVILRICWGFVGTRHARFSSFVRGPAAVLRYLRSLRSGHPEHHTGHNPAGALAILLLLALALLTTASGWADFNDIGGEWLASAHETLAGLLLSVAAVHLAGVVVASRLHQENLVLAMLTGRKPIPPAAAATDRRDAEY